SALGALVAVSVKEVFEAQTLSNFFRFPMVFVCGVFMPVETMPLALQVVAYLLPLTYSVNVLNEATCVLSSGISSLVNVVAIVSFFAFFFVGCERIMKRSMK
ncbi:ABC transporter permease, partial [Candidatus Thorarchaeota archaeon]